MTSELQHTLSQTVSLLNKGIDHIPRAMNVVIRQYALQQYVIAGSLFILTVIGLIIFLAALHSHLKVQRVQIEKNGVSDWEESFVQVLTMVGSGAVIITAAYQGVNHLANAVAPIIGMINTLK